MADVADLAMRFRAEGARQSQRDMDAVTASADRAGQQADQLARRSDNLGGAFARLRAAAVPLASALAAAFGVREMARAADAWSTMSWRMQNATGSAQSAARAMQQISDVARNTWTSIDQTADAFLRQEATMSALGYTVQEQIDHIEALNSALLVSGLRGARAEQVSAAWSRAMARGALRGDEFNSVAENSTRLMQALAEAMGVSVPELRALAEEGKITSDVMFQITESLEGLRKEMEGDATLSGALVILRNSFTELIGTVDSTSRVTSSLGNAILVVADNFGRVAAYVATATAGFVAYRAALLGVAAAKWLVTNASIAMRRAIMATGIGALVIAAGELVYQFSRLVQATGGFGEAFKLVGDLAREVWERMTLGLQGFGASVVAIAYNIQAAFIGAFAAVMQRLSDLTQWAADGVNEMFAAAGIEANLQGLGVETAERFGQAFEEVSEKARAAGESANEFFRQATAPLESWQAMLDVIAEYENASDTAEDAAERLRKALAGAGEEGAKAFAKFRDQLRGVMNELFPVEAAMTELAEKQAMIERGVQTGLITADQGAEAMQRLAASYRDAINPLEAIWRGLEEERALIAMTAQERAVHTQMQQLENELRQAGIVLTQQQRTELEQEVRSLQQTREATENYNNSVQELGRSIDSSFDQMTDALARGENAWEALGRIAINVLEDIIMHVLQANDAFGGGGQSFGSAIAEGLASLFHSGGIVGQPTATRMVSPLAFAGAPRMHSGGIAGDEVPAILKRGEEVLPENHPRHRNNAGGGVEVNIPVKVVNNAPVQVRTRQAQAPGGGKQLEILIDEMNARNIGSPGTASNKAVRNSFGAQPMLTTRG